MYYVYILRSIKDSKFYVGFTSYLQRRMKEHNQKLSPSTRSRTPLELIFYEAHRNRKDAMAREKFLKTGWGRNYVQKILENYLRENK